MAIWRTDGFFGGHTFLDFLNTVDDEGRTRTAETLPGWPEALAWARLAGVVTEPEAKRLAARARYQEADAALASLLELRELAWSVLSAKAAGRRPDRRQLDRLGAAIRAAFDRASLTESGEGFAWTVTVAAEGLEVVRLRLLIALAALLQGPELARLKQCGRCTWLFLDHGRGVGRRWCRMETCGNRAKAERFRRK